ncbi:MAG: PilZ domain-containing protein [Desulfomonilaceae bacterium]|nr:PilZ domain-containing protein [Desulfomonilaceae bacterium]
MNSPRPISAAALVTDIRSGMTEAELMAKYGISRKYLTKALRRLVSLKAVPHSELYERSPTYRKSCDDIQNRRRPRVDVSIPLPIYCVESAREGLIRDISETGFRVAGIPSRIGVVRTFQLSVEMFIGFDPLLLIAECVWEETRGAAVRYPVAGYDIKYVSEADLEALRKLVQLLLLSKSGEWKTLR